MIEASRTPVSFLLPEKGGKGWRQQPAPFTIDGCTPSPGGGMNPVPGTNEPAQGTVWSRQTGRRTFLRGAAMAGAATLAVPLLGRSSAKGSSTAVILGCNSGIYNNDP